MVVHLFLGPMFAGKTSKMLEMHERIGGVILDFHEGNMEKGMVMNHDGYSGMGIKTRCLFDVLESIENYRNIFINEGQFFDDLYEFVLEAESWDECNVYIFALDGDFKRRPMGHISQVLPLCDRVEKLRGKCTLCVNESLFSKRTVKSEEQYLPDASAYMPLCRKCYNNAV